jgi:hypothetical protein
MEFVTVPRLSPMTVTSPVVIAQIAPTILLDPGFDPNALQAVRMAH